MTKMLKAGKRRQDSSHPSRLIRVPSIIARQFGDDDEFKAEVVPEGILFRRVKHHRSS